MVKVPCTLNHNWLCFGNIKELIKFLGIYETEFVHPSSHCQHSSSNLKRQHRGNNWNGGLQLQRVWILSILWGEYYVRPSHWKTDTSYGIKTLELSKKAKSRVYTPEDVWECTLDVKPRSLMWCGMQGNVNCPCHKVSTLKVVRYLTQILALVYLCWVVS